MDTTSKTRKPIPLPASSLPLCYLTCSFGSNSTALQRYNCTYFEGWSERPLWKVPALPWAAANLPYVVHGSPIDLSHWWIAYAKNSKLTKPHLLAADEYHIPKTTIWYVVVWGGSPKPKHCSFKEAIWWCLALSFGTSPPSGLSSAFLLADKDSGSAPPKGQTTEQEGKRLTEVPSWVPDWVVNQVYRNGCEREIRSERVDTAQPNCDHREWTSYNWERTQSQWYCPCCTCCGRPVWDTRNVLYAEGRQEQGRGTGL